MGARLLIGALALGTIFVADALICLDAVDRYDRRWDRRALHGAALLSDGAMVPPCGPDVGELARWHALVLAATAPPAAWRRYRRRTRLALYCALGALVGTAGLLLALWPAARVSWEIFLFHPLCTCTVLVATTVLLRAAARPPLLGQVAEPVYAAFGAGAAAALA